MKHIFYSLILVMAIVSCSKKNDIVTPVTPVVLPDTLSAGWSKIPVENTGIQDIFFIDNITGYVATGSGIYKSTNGGTSWSQINSGNSYFNIGAFGNSACFINNTNVLFSTRDGGAGFQLTTVTDNIADCFYTSATNCVISGSSTISRSTDGGLSFPTSYNIGDGSGYSSLFFLTALNGWDIRTSGIYKTTDGGATWSLVHTIFGSPSSVEFIDNSNGYYSSSNNVGNSAVYKTTDGGATWNEVFQNNSNQYNDIDFVSVNEGYVCAGKRIYKTTDGGTTWNVVVALGNTYISEIHFTDATHGWACNSDGTILKLQ